MKRAFQIEERGAREKREAQTMRGFLMGNGLEKPSLILGFRLGTHFYSLITYYYFRRRRRRRRRKRKRRREDAFL